MVAAIAEKAVEDLLGEVLPLSPFSPHAFYVVFYAHKSDGMGGVGGCTLTQEDFQRLRNEFGERVSFRSTGTYPEVMKKEVPS